jgi:hypothetical protein
MIIIVLAFLGSMDTGFPRGKWFGVGENRSQQIQTTVLAPNFPHYLILT